jgi:secondary thiamine-phosphate synthase enzyme
MSASRTIIEHACAAVKVATKGPGFYRLGNAISRRLKEMGARDGVATVFCTHTSASLCIQENADPTVLEDLADSLSRLAPENAPYRHDTEGPDDMPAHIKTLFTATSLSLPVRGGKLGLGIWQEIYLIEHREGGHERRIEVDFIGGFARNPLK